MSLLSARIFFVVSLLITASAFGLLTNKAYAQVINTPTPTATPIVPPTSTPTPAVATATPVSDVLIVTETPTPTLPETGPAETFALVGLGSIALVVLGSILFFAL